MAQKCSMFGFKCHYKNFLNPIPSDVKTVDNNKVLDDIHDVKTEIKDVKMEGIKDVKTEKIKDVKTEKIKREDRDDINLQNLNCFEIGDDGKREQCLKNVEVWRRDDKYKKVEKILGYFKKRKSFLLDACNKSVKSNGDVLVTIHLNYIHGEDYWDKEIWPLVSEFAYGNLGMHPDIVIKELKPYKPIKNEIFGISHYELFVNCNKLHRL